MSAVCYILFSRTKYTSMLIITRVYKSIAFAQNTQMAQKIQSRNRLVKYALSLIKIMVHKQCQQALL